MNGRNGSLSSQRFMPRWFTFKLAFIEVFGIIEEIEKVFVLDSEILYTGDA